MEHDPLCPILAPEAHPICLCGVIAQVRADQHLKTTASTTRDISEDIAQAIEAQMRQWERDGRRVSLIQCMPAAVRIARSFASLPVDNEPDRD